MKQISDEAYVLQTQVLGETDRIVSLFTAGHGKVRGVATAARKSRRRFGAWLEPLSHVQVEWTEKPGRDLHRIDRVEGLRSFVSMQSRPDIQAACAVLSEVAQAFAHEGQEDAQTFKLLGAVLDALEADTDPFIAVRYFEYWMLRLHGLLPALDFCGECGRDLPRRRSARIGREGGLLCATCRPQESGARARLSPSDRRFLEAARRNPPAALDVPAAAAVPGGALEHLLRGTLESFAERRFRSYRHLATRQGEIGRGR